MASLVKTESYVAGIGGTSTSYPSRCCTKSRAIALNCNVTSPSNASDNQLITGVSAKTPGYDCAVRIVNETSYTLPEIHFDYDGSNYSQVLADIPSGTSGTYYMKWSNHSKSTTSVWAVGVPANTRIILAKGNQAVYNTTDQRVIVSFGSHSTGYSTKTTYKTIAPLING